MEINRTKSGVVVLGAGIMGCSIALYLAMQKISVILIDQASEPFTGASRWNEGKIHLGYLYGADPSLKTARKLIPGGLAFPSLIEELVGRKLAEHLVTRSDDRYLIHKDSVVSAEEVIALARKVTGLVRAHPDANEYFVPLDQVAIRSLSPGDLAKEYNPEFIQAAIEVPERSVLTNDIADYFVDAVRNTPLIECVLNHRVTGVSEIPGRHGFWNVTLNDARGNNECIGPFYTVVNALWEGRQQIDATVGLETAETWTNRFRVSLFAKLENPTALRSAVIAVGPFGDIKNYNGRDLYLSWYDSGLLEESHALCPPEILMPNQEQKQRILKEKSKYLTQVIPEVANVLGAASEIRTEGGWVYAAGKGNLKDARSELHRRNRVGSYANKGYFSVDTGKYSIAPWLAKNLVNEIVA